MVDVADGVVHTIEYVNGVFMPTVEVLILMNSRSFLAVIGLAGL